MSRDQSCYRNKDASNQKEEDDDASECHFGMEFHGKYKQCQNDDCEQKSLIGVGIQKGLEYFLSTYEDNFKDDPDNENKNRDKLEFEGEFLFPCNNDPCKKNDPENDKWPTVKKRGG